jgi:hypothetical protein
MELDASTPREQYERLFLELTARIDTGHASDGVELFTPDAVLEVGGRSYCGHDEIAGFLALREARSDPVSDCRARFRLDPQRGWLMSERRHQRFA